MEKLVMDKIMRFIKSRKKLQEELGVNLSNKGKEVFIQGEGEDEYDSLKVLEALDFGFAFSQALSIKKQNFDFAIIKIKNYTKSKNLERIKSRIIGKSGKTLKTISTLTNCFLEIKENEVGIIGDLEDLENAERAIISIIQGSKQENVYYYLETHHPKKTIDLGLKKGFQDKDFEN